MRKYLFILSSIFILSCSVDETRIAAPADDSRNLEEDSGNVVIVKANDALVTILEDAAKAGGMATKSEPLNDAFSLIGATGFERLFPYEEEFEERTRHDGLHRYYIVKFDSSVPATKAAEALQPVNGVLHVSRPRPVTLRSAIPNDPDFKWQWDMYNDKSLKLAITNNGGYSEIGTFANLGADCNVETVWENYTTGSSDVIVCVVDEGVDLNHPDLASNTVAAGTGGSWNFVNNSKNISPGHHGTHVAGTIAAVRNNGVGVAGLAGGDAAAGVAGVKIMSCQILGSDSEASSYNTARAIKWGADHGAVISQNSWGYGPEDSNNNGEFDPNEIAAYKKESILSSDYDWLRDAIDYFINRAGCEATAPFNQRADSPMKGGLMVFAAGNDAIDYDLVGNYEPVISVGAGTAGYTRAWYSNYGSWVDICAPGGDNLGGGFGSDYLTLNYGKNSTTFSRGNIYNLYSTIDDGDYFVNYGYMSGTSMACPHVSGVAALLVSYFGGNGFTNEECKRLLLEGANKNYIDNKEYVGPWLDAAASFLLGVPTSTIAPDKVSDWSAEAVRKTIVVNCKVPADQDDVKAQGIRVLVGTTESSVRNCNPSKPSLTYVDIPTQSVPAGTMVRETITGLSYDSTYYLAVYAFDRSKNFSEISDVKGVTTPTNQAPEVNVPVDGVLLYGQGAVKLVDISKLFIDKDEDVLSYSCQSMDDLTASAVYASGRIRINAKNAGFTYVVVTADDGEKTGVYRIPVLVKESIDDPVETLPSPVTTDLMIRTEESASTFIRVVSSSGKVVYEQTRTISGFDPLVINMTGLAPGRYGVTVKYNGKTYKKTIVKV